MLFFKWEMQLEDLCTNENESVGKEFDDTEDRRDNGKSEVLSTIGGLLLQFNSRSRRRWMQLQREA